ncbi:unnamed protein product [Adineta steineri]|uniref:Uncharacterized protein n=1 Tax=Adineta steineri TaxID=433720 RepID=A0A820KYA5_9BILA|nr:unnamed protein product [Adineta steineri]
MFYIDWDTCSKSCGGGIQKRRRTCLINANNCSECLEETRLCQESPCPIQQATLWSDWTSTTNPMNDGSIAEKRTLFICTINSLSNKQLPEIKSDTVKYRVCDTHAVNDCQETDSLDNELIVHIKRVRFSAIEPSFIGFVVEVQSLHNVAC